MNNPQIRIFGTTAVRIDPMQSIDDVLLVSDKMTAITQADTQAILGRMMTSLGDLNASFAAKHDREAPVEEVAELFVGVCQIARKLKMDARELLQHAADVVSGTVTRTVTDSVCAMMAERGADNIVVQR